MTNRTWSFLDPRVLMVDDRGDRTAKVDGSIAGKLVGLRLDRAWRSYEFVVDEWTGLLERDGAIVKPIYAGERIGDGGQKTRDDLDEWARLIDIGVVGLGN